MPLEFSDDARFVRAQDIFFQTDRRGVEIDAFFQQLGRIERFFFCNFGSFMGGYFFENGHFFSFKKSK